MSGFAMAYFVEDMEPLFLYAHGGFAIVIYVVFYLAMFGKDEVKWMFTNAALGIFGIYAEVSWILDGAGKSISDYPLYIHVIPFLYYVLYQFLLRQMFLDITGSRDNPEKKKQVERFYVALWVGVYAFIYFGKFF
jgi:hypothetical protein